MDTNKWTFRAVTSYFSRLSVGDNLLKESIFNNSPLLLFKNYVSQSFGDANGFERGFDHFPSR